MWLNEIVPPNAPRRPVSIGVLSSPTRQSSHARSIVPVTFVQSFTVAGSSERSTVIVPVPDTGRSPSQRETGSSDSLYVFACDDDDFEPQAASAASKSSFFTRAP